MLKNEKSKCEHKRDYDENTQSGRGYLQINNEFCSIKEGWYSLCKKCGETFYDNKWWRTL